MNVADAKSILAKVSQFQLRAESIMRYEGNPYVEGDNIAEHQSRCIRIAAYIMPHLLFEFDEPCLAGEIYATLLFHDDDEILEGFDIITSKKEHNVKDKEEVKNLDLAMTEVNKKTKEYVVSLFRNFRARETLASKIAKVIDNLAGNQLVYEQKLGVIAPDSVKFAIWYINNEKVRGVSKTTDTILDAHTQMFYDYRKFVETNEQEIVKLAELAHKQTGCNKSVSEMRDIIRRLLKIKIENYELKQEDIDKPLWEY